MTTDQKIIKNKLGLLKLAERLGNVSEACKVFGYSGPVLNSVSGLRVVLLAV